MSTIHSLLLPIDGGPDTEARLALAQAVAERWQASVLVCHSAPPALASAPWELAPGTVELLAELDRERLARSRSAFDAAAAAAPGLRWQWQASAGADIVAEVSALALWHDLSVMLLPRGDARLARQGADTAASIVLKSPHPALLVPAGCAAPARGAPAIVACKASAESVRALQAALPWLREASSTHLLAWGDSALADTQAAAAYLARHGIVGETLALPKPLGGVGPALLTHADAMKAGLLVMGCYGHSRAREWIMGGVTQRVLDEAALPLLMAH